MIYVPLQHLRPEMVLARDIVCGLSPFALVVSGQKLTDLSIGRLQEHGVRGAYIESEVCNDVEVEDFIDPVFKQKTMDELKTIYDGYAAGGKPAAQTLRAVSEIAHRLLMQVANMDACMANIMELKEYDSYTYSHSMYVGLFSTLIGMQENMTKSQLGELALAGLLHDIGKLHIAKAIVHKPARLNEQEFEVMKTHPPLATEQLWPYQKFSAAVIAGVESHHERVDGSGYPRGLVGDQIPLYGRILAIADVYDALTSERPYRRAWLPSETLEYMMAHAGIYFDEKLLGNFLRVVAAYPIGTVVLLSNGMTGVVIKNFSENTLRPLVRILAPEDLLGLEIDLLGDRRYFNVTIIDVLSEEYEMPNVLFRTS